MRKLTLFFMTLILFNLSFAAEDTTFTFQGFSPVSPSVVKSTKRVKVLGKSRVSYPMFFGKSGNITKNMNKNMEKFISDYKSSRNKIYTVTSEVKGDNSAFVSVLFTVEEKDTKTGEKITSYDGISFNVKDGKPLKLKDVLVDGFNDALTDAVNDKFRQFGLPQVAKFDAVSKKQNFYLENDSLVLIYNQGEGTNFADGQVFIPFILTDLIGILK
ncbi:DUF3298 domain-containing protein [Leptotrichia sp. HSP-342]|uniref:DUF3298 domain-containing protein n=1 Tax=Leptotrichia mesophila TaxID=3239303 RepID=A0AB39VD67_9FUSO